MRIRSAPVDPPGKYRIPMETPPDPWVPVTYLLAGLAGIDPADHQRRIAIRRSAVRVVVTLVVMTVPAFSFMS